MNTPYTPLLYTKIRVYRGIHYFLIFALKHRLWVLTCTHNLCFEQKYENKQNFSTENCHFYSREKLHYITWACFRNGDDALILGVIIRNEHYLFHVLGVTSELDDLGRKLCIIKEAAYAPP